MAGRQIKVTGDHDETLDLTKPENREIHKKEMAVARAVMTVLQEAYPGHPWAVRVDAKGKYKAAMIKLPAIMRSQDHYVLPLPKLLGGTIGDFKRLVIEAGGHIMERFRIPRAGFREDPFVLARNAHILRPGAGVPT